MMMMMTLALAASLATAAPQTNGSTRGTIAQYLERAAFHAAPLEARDRLTQARPRDSLKNGAVIGAVVGGAAAGLMIGYLCHVFNDSDELRCWQPVLLWTALGAGGGALVGAGVDALFQRRIVFRATVRF